MHPLEQGKEEFHSSCDRPPLLLDPLFHWWLVLVEFLCISSMPASLSARRTYWYSQMDVLLSCKCKGYVGMFPT